MSKSSVALDRLDHFAITVRDIEATCAFYEKVLGMSRETQLMIITLTTVAVFNIQFWWLSDPRVINVKKGR